MKLLESMVMTGGSNLPKKKRPTRLADRANPKVLQDDFSSKHCRSLPIQSFQILQQCYHPYFNNVVSKDAPPPVGDYILVLEQQYRPVAPPSAKKLMVPPQQTTVELTEYFNSAIQNMGHVSQLLEGSDDAIEL